MGLTNQAAKVAKSLDDKTSLSPVAPIQFQGGIRDTMSAEREIDLAKISDLLRSSLARIIRNASVCEVTMDSVQRSRRAVERSHATLQKADDLIRRTGGLNSD